MADIFNPQIPIGSVISEDELYQRFKCQQRKGIRPCKEKRLLVLINKTYENEYEDVWDGDILHYIGMNAGADENGNQTLNDSSNNNAKLYEACINYRKFWQQIFLFVKDAENCCRYEGEVIPYEEPYQKAVPSLTTGIERIVWVFPVQLKPINRETNLDFFVAEELKVLELDSSAQLRQAMDASVSWIKGSQKQSASIITSRTMARTTVFSRDPHISAYVKTRANGICDLCGCRAPFIGKDGRPYLEEHHVIWLAQGGADSIDNAVALCPNCHRRMHALANIEDASILMDRLSFYRKEEGRRKVFLT